MTADLLRLLDEAFVPGAALSIVRDGRLERSVALGVRGGRESLPVDEHTVFDAASLSKPVFAHLVLQLVDQSALALDSRLNALLPGYIAHDPRAAKVTVGDVLSHSAGLPNWRNADWPLRTWFAPGERFSYSGEGYLWLQRAIEALSGETLQALAERLLLGPLGMTRSSFVWQQRLGDNRAWPHDAFGQAALGNKPGEANAAFSLQTTAADYARFLREVLAGTRLAPETARLWLAPRIAVRHRGIQWLGPSAEDQVTGVAWGLGWGLEPDHGTFFHWGDNGPFTSFVVGSVAERQAVVVFANGASGHSIMADIVATAMPGALPSLAWLDYARHDAPVRRLLRLALAQGIAATWPELEQAKLEAGDLGWIAQGLSARGRAEDSLWLQARIAAAKEGTSAR